MQQLRQMTPNTDPHTIINFFDAEEERLRKELESVVMAKETMKKFLKLDPDEIKQVTEHLNVATKSLSRTSTKNKDIPTEYNPEDRYKKKILYVLNALGESSTPEITDYIYEKEVKIDPKISRKLIDLNVGKNAIRLHEEGKVLMEKVGNRNIFRLK